MAAFHMSIKIYIRQIIKEGVTLKFRNYFTHILKKTSDEDMNLTN